MSTLFKLYLVTDSSHGILGDRDLVQVVSAAIDGGVTIIQYRDKTSTTAELIRMGRKLHRVTSVRGVPLLVNDRVDVAMAIGAEGVHLGQEDMDIVDARVLLGPDAIIGISCSTIEEAQFAISGGANYLGIGTMFATLTKGNTKQIIGTAGTKAILNVVSKAQLPIATVAIGGINASNVQRVLFQSQGTHKGLDGVAVVSGIIGSKDPKSASAQLLALISRPRFIDPTSVMFEDCQGLLQKVPHVVKEINRRGPVCHNMTNLVVQNISANVAIAIGASPIMANDGLEARDISTFSGCLLVNLGSVNSSLESYVQSLEAYNHEGKPILLDPVGVGATGLRRATVKTLMTKGYFDIIKGNRSEVMQILEDGTAQQKGVDSSPNTLTENELASAVKHLAFRERNIVLMTGEVDYLSDGVVVLALSNGVEILGQITGSGCTLGTVVACCIAVERRNPLLAALAGVLLFNIAAEVAVSLPSVLGPGTFVPAFIDSLHQVAKRLNNGDTEWFLGRAKVKKVG